jgi:hypothetical protein
MRTFVSRDDGLVAGPLVTGSGPVADVDNLVHPRVVMTWGDTVLVRADAPPHLRPGCFASIVAITRADKRSTVSLEKMPPGTVYMIEFGDGSHADAHESHLEPVDE